MTWCHAAKYRPGSRDKGKPLICHGDSSAASASAAEDVSIRQLLYCANHIDQKLERWTTHSPQDQDPDAESAYKLQLHP